MSNLPFISKIIEKVVNTRIEQQLLENNLHDPLQSAYRKHHSTETALIKIQHDIVQALDSGRVAALVLLDLSAAFDTIDHTILFKRLKETHGMSVDALLWMASYLRQRCQQVIIGEDASADVTLGYGVPQGSVLGPKLYSLYTQPLGNIIRHHKLDVHFYADDTQLYVFFINSDREEQERTAAVTRLNDCIRDVHTWLTRNMLKLNEEKTEVILFTSKHGLKYYLTLLLPSGNNNNYNHLPSVILGLSTINT